MFNRFLLVGALALGISHSAVANDFADAKEIGRFGNWKVVRKVDPFDDRVSCVGLYGSDYTYQLSHDALYVASKLYETGIQMKFDSKPTEQMRISTDMEDKIDAIIIEGSDFDKVLASNLLRIQIYSSMYGKKNIRVDLAGTQKAAKAIAECEKANGNV